jgi:peptidoglycan/xylan/chitin deacetylase (PgdA/CDA1 family)
MLLFDNNVILIDDLDKIFFIEKDKTTMKKLILSILFFCGVLSYGQKKQVCFTFDDLPVATLSFRSNEFQKSVTTKILSAITKHKIPAIGFVNEIKLFNNNEPDSSKIYLLMDWLDAGLELGNHTYSHMDYHKVSTKKYFEDIVKGEKITKLLMAHYGKSIRYFRHPFLHAGESKEKTDSLDLFLKNAGYTIAPVTIDNSDWIFSLAYDSAMVKKDTSLMKSIGSTYIDYMERKLKYFEKQSNKLFGRNIRQILLIHANAINADYLNELARMYEKNNYKFVTLTQALEDKAYTTNISVFNRNWGISWLDRWALSQGKTGEFFKDEPKTPENIMKLAKVTNE